MSAILGPEVTAVSAAGRRIAIARPQLHVRYAREAGLDAPLGTPSRPAWRGRVHLVGLVASAPAMLALVGLADGERARVACAAYAVGLVAMLTVSVTYHRWVHRLCTRARWRRADHAMIFAAIGGSATPVAVLAAPGPSGAARLVIVWSLCAAGAACKLSRWARSDAAGSLSYVVVCAVVTTLLPDLWRHGGALPAAMFITSTVVYTVGAICFARAFPRLRPSVFSYHEVWHVLTLLAATAHFVAVWSIAT